MRSTSFWLFKFKCNLFVKRSCFSCYFLSWKLLSMFETNGIFEMNFSWDLTCVKVCFSTLIKWWLHSYLVLIESSTIIWNKNLIKNFLIFLCRCWYRISSGHRRIHKRSFKIVSFWLLTQSCHRIGKHLLCLHIKNVFSRPRCLVAVFVCFMIIVSTCW